MLAHIVHSALKDRFDVTTANPVIAAQKVSYSVKVHRSAARKSIEWSRHETMDGNFGVPHHVGTA
jgi:hypothetical protein